MKPLSVRQIYLIVFLLLLLFILPLILFLSKKRQDIRPRALVGAANFILSNDLPDGEIKAGTDFHVTVSLQVTNPAVKITGVDFMLLYDKDKLLVKEVFPATNGANAYFSEAPIVTLKGLFDDTFYYLRVAEIAKKSDANLGANPVQLASITFHALTNGDAVIKFPQDNKYLQVTGIGPTGTIPTTPPNPSITTIAISPTVPSNATCQGTYEGFCTTSTICAAIVTGGVNKGQVDCGSGKICCVISIGGDKPTPTPPVIGSTCKQNQGVCTYSLLCVIAKGQDKGQLDCNSGKTCCVSGGGRPPPYE